MCLEPSRSETVMATPVSSYSSTTFFPLTNDSVAMSRAWQHAGDAGR